MLMPPQSVRTAPLFVDKTRGRPPRGNLTFPCAGNPMNAEPLSDARSGRYSDGSGSQHLEPQGGRCDRLKVEGIAKELEEFVARLRQPKLRSVVKLPHGAE